MRSQNTAKNTTPNTKKGFILDLWVNEGHAPVAGICGEAAVQSLSFTSGTIGNAAIYLTFDK